MEGKRDKVKNNDKFSRFLFTHRNMGRISLKVTDSFAPMPNSF
jgi:hypothetical protein